jgi:glycosyltransferase involved in cell wall biosynthesis
MQSKNPQISVVIPCLNEEKNIAKTLLALEKQTFQDFELIFVDNNSIDKTAEIINSFEKRIPKLILIKEPIKGIGVARNTGCKVAQGKILVSTDADVEPEPKWLEKIEREFEKDSKAIVGTYRFSDKSPFFNLLFRFFMIASDYINVIIIGTFAFRGLNHALNKDVYEQAGGFNERISALEDLDLALRVKKITKIKYCPRIEVLTSYRRFEGRFFRQLVKRLRAYFNRAI